MTDTEPPQITCPIDFEVVADEGACETTVAYPLPVAWDNCSLASLVRTSGPASGATFPVGVTLVEFVFDDPLGNPHLCAFTVTVRDVEPPAISCPDAIEAVEPAPGEPAIVTYEIPAATDNCDGVSTERSLGAGSGAAFARGLHTESYVATDAGGNRAGCDFAIAVFPFPIEVPDPCPDVGVAEEVVDVEEFAEPPDDLDVPDTPASVCPDVGTCGSCDASCPSCPDVGTCEPCDASCPSCPDPATSGSSAGCTSSGRPVPGSLALFLVLLTGLWTWKPISPHLREDRSDCKNTIRD